eukprot:Hpha_TRINITY_DN15358_c4_g6::TRINITY_DN15358_c4_g6_i1::g.87466::m.87466
MMRLLPALPVFLATPMPPEKKEITASRNPMNAPLSLNLENTVLLCSPVSSVNELVLLQFPPKVLKLVVLLRDHRLQALVLRRLVQLLEQNLAGLLEVLTRLLDLLLELRRDGRVGAVVLCTELLHLLVHFVKLPADLRLLLNHFVELGSDTVQLLNNACVLALCLCEIRLQLALRGRGGPEGGELRLLQRVLCKEAELRCRERPGDLGHAERRTLTLGVSEECSDVFDASSGLQALVGHDGLLQRCVEGAQQRCHVSPRQHTVPELRLPETLELVLELLVPHATTVLHPLEELLSVRCRCVGHGGKFLADLLIKRHCTLF